MRGRSDGAGGFKFMRLREESGNDESKEQKEKGVLKAPHLQLTCIMHAV